jgi:hypothetical protein
MSKSWGPPCWYLFHSLAAKVKEEEFENVKMSFWSIITSTCANLPCPECRQHATAIVSSVNKNNVLRSKVSLEKFLFDFHNSVNKRKRYKIFTVEEYESRYKNADLNKVINLFIATFNQSTRNNKLMLDGMQRQMFMKNFISWINANRSKFN